MSYSIAGLPLHPLLVHATVVIVPGRRPERVVGSAMAPVSPLGMPLPLGLAVAGLILDPLSTSSGESLEHQVGDSALIEKHSELADGLLPWMIVLVVMAAALHAWYWGQSRRETSKPATSRAWVPVVLSALAVVAALGTSLQVVLIGHSGAKAAWSGVASQSAGAGRTNK